MSKTRKAILFAVGGSVGLLFLLALGVLLFVDINAHKPRLEAAASDALGMRVRVDGRLGLGFFPGLHVTLNDVRVRNRETDVASAKALRLGIGVLPLLRAQVRVDRIAVLHPVIAIKRDRDGQLNVDNPERAAGVFPALDSVQVSLLDATFQYTDEKAASTFSAEGCNVILRDLRISNGKRSNPLTNISGTIDLDCATVQAQTVALSALTVSGAANGGKLDFTPVSMQVFGGRGSGSVQADFSGAVPSYVARFALSQFHIEEFLQTLSPKPVVNGLMDLSVNLMMQGDTVHEVKASAAGEISLRGESLVFEGSDLDKEFSRYEASQNFNLVDVGAFFFIGPVGLATTKGYNFARIVTGSGGSTKIRTLVSEWKVEQGVARAQDVAMATEKNRLALTGGLDFADEQFVDVIAALIDANGCATVEQTISGPFQKPVVKQPNFLVSLAGPALRLLKKGRDLFPGGECKPFYTGSVAPPTGAGAK